MARRRVRTGAPGKFDETKHRRGGAKNRGQFAAGGSGGADNTNAAPPRGRARGGAGGGVAAAHAIFDKLRGKPRAEVLAAATAAGINANTARTQLYHWQRAEAKRALAGNDNPTRADLQAAAAVALGVRGAKPPATKPAAPKQPTAMPVRQPPKPAATPVTARQEAGSSADRFARKPGERPVAHFRRIAEELHDRPRAEVIATAVSAGVNRSTASVQYSALSRARAAAPAEAPVSTPPASAVPARQPAAAARRSPRARTASGSVGAPKPAAKAVEAAPAKRDLIQDGSSSVPKPGTPARQFHDKLLRASSVFKGAKFSAHYDDGGRLRYFSVERSSGYGPEGVSITRRFSVDGTSVDHSYFQIGDGERRTGAAKTFLSETVEAYRQKGIKKVTVHANIDVGGYAWIRYGFKPDIDGQAELMQTVTSRLTSFTVRRHLSDDETTHVLKLVQAKDFEGIAAISKPLPRLDGTSLPLGRHLFLGSDWFGSLDLTNEKQYATFRRYAGAK